MPVFEFLPFRKVLARQNKTYQNLLKIGRYCVDMKAEFDHQFTQAPALSSDHKPADDSPVPLYRTMAEAIILAVRDGRLRSGEKLPSVGQMSRLQGVSRNTVSRCYQELAGRGYVQSNTGASTCISNLPAGSPLLGKEQSVERLSSRRDLPPLSEFGNYIMQMDDVDSELVTAQVNYGLPAESELPLKQWQKALQKQCLQLSPELTQYDAEPFGSLRLRMAIASYLERSRAIHCSAEQIVIFAGAPQALDLSCRLLIDSTDSVAMENPGYMAVRRTLKMHAASVESLRVDQDGLCVEELRRLDDCKFVYVTPAHQDPTGAVMSGVRRAELLKWATRGGIIWEDDHDSEYRYGNTAIPALKASDRNESVIHFGSFWRTLGALTRLSYVVLPSRLVPLFRKAKATLCRELPVLEQLALADFINCGDFERHILRTRLAYTKRRQAMIYQLTIGLRKSIKISRESAGMHIVVQFDSSYRDEDIAESARLAGLPLLSTSSYYDGEARAGEFLVAFAQLTEQEIAEAAEKFAVNLLPASV